eukprot:4474636-Heterocapsa_arctica.AAC.1
MRVIARIRASKFTSLPGFAAVTLPQKRLARAGIAAIVCTTAGRAMTREWTTNILPYSMPAPRRPGATLASELAGD